MTTADRMQLEIAMLDCATRLERLRLRRHDTIPCAPPAFAADEAPTLVRHAPKWGSR